MCRKHLHNHLAKAANFISNTTDKIERKNRQSLRKFNKINEMEIGKMIKIGKFKIRQNCKIEKMDQWKKKLIINGRN